MIILRIGEGKLDAVVCGMLAMYGGHRKICALESQVVTVILVV